MTWEMIGTLIAFFAMALGYLTWFEKRREKKAEQRAKTASQERCDLKEDIKKTLCNDMKACVIKELEPYVLKNDANSEHERILKSLGALEAKYEMALKSFERTLGSIDEELKEAIISRIQGEIIHFSDSVKRGSRPSSVAYEHIYDAYKKYKLLGGNGFIDDMFNYIKKMRDRHDEVENENTK